MKFKNIFIGFLIFAVGFGGAGSGTAFATKGAGKNSVRKSKSAAYSPKKQLQAKKIKRQIKGMGSWYSRKSPGIRRITASGERFDDSKHTCALWHYPLGTHVRVTNLKTGKSVVCRVNDRGPSRKLRRVIDMSRASFVQIGKLQEGLILVSITPV